MRTATLLWTILLTPLLLAASCRPTIEEFTVRPSVVCPGDAVTMRLISKDVSVGRLTVTPPPAVGPAEMLFGPHPDLSIDERQYVLCTTTQFDAKAWKGDTEGDCTAGNTTCADPQLVSVLEGDDMQRITVAACGGARAGSAAFTIASTDISASLLIRRVVNCSGRTVTLGRAGGSTAPATAEAGAPFAGFDGQSWTGDWTARETVWPGEACPVPGTTRPGPPTTPPPPICIEFTVGCPSTDACMG